MSERQAAIKQCAEWLAECLRIGWDKRDLDRLEALWWKYHVMPESDANAKEEECEN